MPTASSEKQGHSKSLMSEGIAAVNVERAKCVAKRWGGSCAAALEADLCLLKIKSLVPEVEAC